MDLSSFDEMFQSSGSDDSPGVRLYLYRLLQMLASKDVSGASSPVSYDEAKRLSGKMNLSTAEKLVRLFKDLGLGALAVDIGQGHLQVTLRHDSSSPIAAKAAGSRCELERGLIDGTLEKITGMPVTTIETACVLDGDGSCCFQASRELQDGMPAYKPIATGTREHQPAPDRNSTMQQLGSSELKGWYLDAASREIARSRRHEYAFSLLYLDLDNLGEINEALGRHAGDQVINAVANSLGRSCRAEDILWHHGEDEFIIGLAETDTGCAEVVARRMITEVLSSAEYVDFAASISTSIGFSTYPAHAENLTDLLVSARSALYLAKSLGKNRVQVACKADDIEIDSLYQECHQFGDSLFDWPAYRPQRRRSDSSRDRDREEIREELSEGFESSEAMPDKDTAVPNDKEGPLAIEHGRGADEPGKVISPITEADAGMIDEDSSLEGTEISDDVEARRETSAVIASISPILLKGMRQVLSAEEGFAVAGEVKDPSKMPDMIADFDPELVFADKEMAIANNFMAIQRFKDDYPEGKFVIFTTEIDQDILRAAVDFDVDGIIFQDASQTDVLASINLVIRDQRVLPEDVQAAIDELEHHRLLLNELSERELEVLKLVASGKSNSQISKELYITVNTVRFHLANIYQKLNVSNRTEAANYYLRQGLDGGENG